MTTMLRWLNLRHLREQWVRMVVSMLGVVLGVATFVFLPTVAIAMQNSINQSASDLSGSAALEVRSTTTGFSPELADQVRGVPGVAAIAPLSTGGGMLLGNKELLVFAGIDPALDRQVRNHTVASGEFLSAPGQVMLTGRYATEKHIEPGATLTLISMGGTRTLTVVGLLADEGLARLNSGDILLMGLDDAFALRGTRAVDTLSVMPADGLSPADLATRLRPLLPDNVVAELPAERYRSIAEFQTVTTILLATIAVMILGLGSMLIYNAISVAIAQRRAEIGTLRALGVPRGQLQRMYMLEAGVLGFVGSLIGIAAGYGLLAVGIGVQLTPQFTTTPLASQAELVVPPWLLLVALAFGVAIPLLASYLPGRNASRIDPVEAMAHIRSETGTLRFGRWRLVVTVVTVAMMLIIRYTLPLSSLISVMVANTAVMVVLALIFVVFPPYMSWLSHRLPSWMHHIGGMAGRLAAENVTRRPKRMMSIGLYITWSVSTFIYVSQSNFGHADFVDEWNRGENLGHLTVIGAGADPMNPTLPIPVQVVDDISQRADVETVITERLATIQQDGLTIQIRALDMAAFAAAGGRFAWNSGDESTAYALLRDHTRPSVLVRANMPALSHGWTPGHTMQLQTPGGVQDITVVGTFLGSIETDLISIVMDRALYVQWFADTRVDRIQLVARPGVQVNEVRRDLLRQYALSGIVTFDNAEVRRVFATKIDTISTVSSLLSFLMAVVLLAGMTSTLAVMALDRRREIGMLRAVGMRRDQIARSVVVEAWLLVGMGTALGIPVAYLLNAMQEMAMQQIMGLRFALNPAQIVYTLGLLIAAATLAAYLPARGAARTDILEALHYE